MEYTEILESVGFSRSEAIVYVALLKIGKTKSGKIIQITELQSSVVHNALNTLIDKGFVTYIIEGKIKHYCSVNPSRIQKYIQAKKNAYDKILPELSNLQKDAQTLNVEIYEGYKGLYIASLDMLENYHRGSVYKYFAADESLLDKNALEFFSKIDLIKKDYHIKVVGIAEKKSKSKLSNYSSSRIKFISQKIPSAMNIFQDKVLIISFGVKPVGILIRSKEIANQYHKLWDSLWMAK